jgi:hypothetical protein
MSKRAWGFGLLFASVLWVALALAVAAIIRGFERAGYRTLGAH